MVMSDNKNMQGNSDRQRVAGGQDYEVDYLAEQLGVSRERVQQAILAVGNSRTKIEEYIAGRAK
jgi:hypothetical protein